MSVGRRQRVAGRRVAAAALVVFATLVASTLFAAAPAVAATLACQVSAPAVAFGSPVTVTGVVDPAVEGQEVVVTFAGVDVGAALTAADGTFVFAFVPARSGDVAIRLSADGSVSAPVPLVVGPAVAVSHGSLIPFLKTRFVLRVEPATYSGEVVARVTHRGRHVATVRGRCVDGRAVLRVPLHGIDWFTVRFELTPTAELGATSVKRSVKLEWRRLAVGSTGPRVRGVLTQLQRLRIHVPGTGETFTSAVADAVVAFQKAYRLPRDYVVSYDDWRKLDGAARVKARYGSPARHLEIDKTRQIVMVVKDGAVLGTVAVSTGATGNTPVGSFRILGKNPASATWDGSVALPRFMRFHGNMGLHGYPIVPPYPASHGCVREPLWACDWVYDRSFVGERLYIYD